VWRMFWLYAQIGYSFCASLIGAQEADSGASGIGWLVKVNTKYPDGNQVGLPAKCWLSVPSTAVFPACFNRAEVLAQQNNLRSALHCMIVDGSAPLGLNTI